MHSENDELRLRHGKASLCPLPNYKFDKALKSIGNFLNDNSTEGLVIRIKEEGSPKSASAPMRDLMKTYLDRAAPTGGTFADLLLKSDLTGCTTDENGREDCSKQYEPSGTMASLPTLGQLRGKILVLRSSGITPGYGISYSGDHVVDQDMWQVWNVSWTKADWFPTQTGDLQRKKLLINGYLTCAENGSWTDPSEGAVDCANRIVLNYLSGSTGMTPHDVASRTNLLAYRAMGHADRPIRRGIVISDFPGEGLVWRTIMSNFAP